MGVTTVAAPTGTERSSARVLRLWMVAVAIAVLAASFVIGRATGTTTKSTNIVPAAHVQSDPYSCPRRGPC